MQNISHAVNKNKFAMAIFFNLSKAFHIVNHTTLFSNLERYGIRGVAQQWLFITWKIEFSISFTKGSGLSKNYSHVSKNYVQNIFILVRIKYYLTKPVLWQLYCTLFLTYSLYCYICWTVLGLKLFL